MAEETKVMFHQMELDDRILKAIATLAWSQPTLIQETAIPLLLEGKDVLMRARTGSGKTAAFSIPVIQKLLNLKNTSTHQCIRALILSPSKELCGQITSVIEDLTLKCGREIRCVDISPAGDIQAQKSILLDKPDIIVSTPSKALQHLKAQNMKLKDDLAMLVVDEADLIFSFGYEDEIKELLGYLPKIYQAVLASATLSDDVINLKKIVLRNPVTLKLEEPSLAGSSQLQHYHLFAEEDDKAAILYALLKLSLLRGKSIIFVRTVDRCYKLKLYLEQFKISSCVLNSELPAAVRCFSVEQFNKGRYQIIIASDEKSLEKPDGGILPVEEQKKKRDKKQHSKRRKDKESGVSRGIDFQHVANVVNFDFPLDVHSYVHRAGRTARGNNQGSVLSFVSIREKPMMDKVESHLYQTFNNQKVMQKYEFALEEVEGFRYRSRDAWRAVTRIAVREARLKEIKQELLNCKKLQQHSKRRKDKESGVSRGIDFQHVANVVNFDFPLDVHSYVHRAGRTARGNNQGSVLSFVSIREKPMMDKVESHLYQTFNNQKVMQKYEFALEEVEGFRYRSRDAWRAVTRIAVREARLKEIKQELLNCKKLQGYFEDNPSDLAALRRDKALHTVKLQPQLAHVPEYLLPPALRTNTDVQDDETPKEEPPQKKAKSNFKAPKRNKYQARRSNPLQSLTLSKPTSTTT